MNWAIRLNVHRTTERSALNRHMIVSPTENETETLNSIFHGETNFIYSLDRWRKEPSSVRHHFWQGSRWYHSVVASLSSIPFPVRHFLVKIQVFPTIWITKINHRPYHITHPSLTSSIFALWSAICQSLLLFWKDMFVLLILLLVTVMDCWCCDWAMSSSLLSVPKPLSS